MFCMSIKIKVFTHKHAKLTLVFRRLNKLALFSTYKFKTKIAFIKKASSHQIIRKQCIHGYHIVSIFTNVLNPTMHSSTQQMFTTHLLVMSSHARQELVKETVNLPLAHAHAHTRTCTCTHTHVRVHTHTHTHTPGHPGTAVLIPKSTQRQPTWETQLNHKC